MPDDAEDDTEQDNDEFRVEREPLASSAQPRGGALRETDLETVLRGGGSRRRLAQLAGVGVVVVALGALLLHNVAPSAARVIFAPTPTATPVNPALVVAILSNVSSAQATVNGKRVGTLPRVVTLRPDDNTIVFSAPSFSSHTCHINPLKQIQVNQGCEGDEHYSQGVYSPGIYLDGKTVTHTIQLSFTLADLPADQRAGVQTLIATQFDAMALHTTVPAGDYIATASNEPDMTNNRQLPVYAPSTTRRAPAPLAAAMTFAFDSSREIVGDESVLDCQTGACASRLGELGRQVNTTDTLWFVTVSPIVTWRFTSGSATIASATWRPFISGSLVFAYTPQHGWRSLADVGVFPGANASAQIHQQICFIGANLAENLARSANGAQNVNGTGYAMEMDRGVEGCLLSVYNGNLTGTNQADTPTFLYRFGALLAVDAAAHALLPQLPMAPADEIAAVRGY